MIAIKGERMNQLSKIFSVMLLFVVLLGCEDMFPQGPAGPAGMPGPGMDTWTYIIQASDGMYIPDGDYYVYQITDSRFDEYTWIDVWSEGALGERYRVNPEWDEFSGLWMYRMHFLDDSLLFLSITDVSGAKLIFFGVE